MDRSRVYHGVDIVEIERISNAMTRWGEQFLRRVFTERELADAGGRSSSLAARFAAKEAASKALGAGVRGLGWRHETGGPNPVGWHEIEVVRAPTGQPRLHLYGRAAERARELGWHSTSLSISHARSAAIASVTALGTRDALADGGGTDDLLW